MNGEIPNPIYRPPGRVERFAAFFGSLLEGPLFDLPPARTFESAEGTWNPELMQRLGPDAENRIQGMLDAPLDLDS
jgi:hypothetical protein